MHQFWSSLNYNLQTLLSKLQLILQLNLGQVWLQERTSNSAKIETNARRKAVVGTSLFINNNFPTGIHVTLLILIRKKGEHASYYNMVQVLDFPIRFQLSDRRRFSFVFGHNCRCRSEALLLWKEESLQCSQVFQEMWITPVFLFCHCSGDAGHVYSQNRINLLKQILACQLTKQGICKHIAA